MFAGSEIIDPTGLLNNVGLKLSGGQNSPEIRYPGQWVNDCWNNVISSNGQMLTAYWIGSHPAPLGNATPALAHIDAGQPTLGTYLGCASVPAAGLFSFFTGGFSLMIAGGATAIAAAAQHDDVNQCATAFGNFMSDTYNGVSYADWMSGGTDDMSSMIQGIMQAGPSTGLGGDLHFEMSVGPDGAGAAGGGANGPGGGTNGGGYGSADGSDQYGYGGAGSLLKADFATLNQVQPALSASSTSFTFALQTNIGS